MTYGMTCADGSQVTSHFIPPAKHTKNKEHNLLWSCRQGQGLLPLLYFLFLFFEIIDDRTDTRRVQVVHRVRVRSSTRSLITKTHKVTKISFLPRSLAQPLVMVTGHVADAEVFFIYNISVL
jgi:hypothetical protein